MKKTSVDISLEDRDSDYEKRLTTKIQSILVGMEKGSSFFKEAPHSVLPRFDVEEIDYGSILGQGEFGDVFEVIDFPLHDYGACDCSRCLVEASRDDDSTAEDSTHEVIERKGGVGFSKHASFSDTQNIVLVPIRKSSAEICSKEMRLVQSDSENDRSLSQLDKAYMKHHCFASGSSRFALKLVRADIDGMHKLAATLDLAKEAKFLASLSHPNIVKMRATVSYPGHKDFGLLLDRMVTTLDMGILQWKNQVKSRLFTMNLTKRWSDGKALELTRLLAMYDIARAMRYLHKNRICYRDLKPTNVGFDVRGTVKIFDFGLCKEMQDSGEEDFEMTGLTGSRRYMAPEVAKCEHYGLPADVYSFGILFWEVASLNEPFRSLSPDKHFRDVVVKGKRPALCSAAWLPPSMRLLMVQCWRQNPEKRPSFNQISARLYGEIATRQGGGNLKDRTIHLMERSWSSRHGLRISMDVE